MCFLVAFSLHAEKSLCQIKTSHTSLTFGLFYGLNKALVLEEVWRFIEIYMARTKKQAEEIIDIEPEIDDVPQSPPPIMVKTREVREFIAPMVMPAPRDESENVVTVEEMPPQFAPQEPESMESRLRKEVGLTGDRWSMTVYRLSKYAVDGNASLNGNAYALCTKPFDLDSYVDTVLESCIAPDKPNDFLVVVRRNNRVFCHLPVIRAESVARPEQQSAQQGQINNAIPAAVTDPFAEMKKAMRFVKELRELDAPVAPQAPAGEMTTEAAILKVIASDPEQVAKIARRLLPGDSSNDDAMPSWLSALIPIATPFLSAIVQRLTAPPSLPVQQSPGFAPQQIQPQEPPPQFRQAQELTARVIYGIKNALDPIFVAEEVEEFCSRDETLAVFCQPLVTTPPPALAESLRQLAPNEPTLNKPEAIEWLTGFQMYFAQEPETENAN